MPVDWSSSARSRERLESLPRAVHIEIRSSDTTPRERMDYQVSRILAVSFPKSDVAFRERVDQVVAQDRTRVVSAEGVARMQAVLRNNYPRATVVSHGVSTGNLRRAIALDVYRDGPPEAANLLAAWAQAVYDRGGASAYRAAVQVLGDGAASESVVERAFKEVLAWASTDVSWPRAPTPVRPSRDPRSLASESTT